MKEIDDLMTAQEAYLNQLEAMILMYEKEILKINMRLLDIQAKIIMNG